ncbi:MerR family transcriptional regulator [Micromonospora fluostatini]|uniref:MerR family transcriptional regulator n=1 Tax=Micromonospora sp. JCM 30529 TaxID=3421643 RepID=UPI003D166811
MDTLYSIGEVARRTGLSVSAIRFYSDTGIITPTGHTDAGHRRYDIRAVARLELVRTLRDLGASLDDIRPLSARPRRRYQRASLHLAARSRQGAELTGPAAPRRSTSDTPGRRPGRPAVPGSAGPPTGRPARGHGRCRHRAPPGRRPPDVRRPRRRGTVSGRCVPSATTVRKTRPRD